MEQFQSGVSAMLHEKLRAGDGVSHKDLLDICAVTTHNGAQLAKLEARVQVLEGASSKAPEPESVTQPTLKEETIIFRGAPAKVLVLS